MNVPFKIKMFVVPSPKVILTKDNLAKRNWNGCKKCASSNSDESIHLLFFSYLYTTQLKLIHLFVRLVWRVVHFTFSVHPPTSATNMSDNWLNGVDKETKTRIRICIYALVWALWSCRIDIIFTKQ
jgi:hypothetical protein